MVLCGLSQECMAQCSWGKTKLCKELAGVYSWCGIPWCIAGDLNTPRFASELVGVERVLHSYVKLSRKSILSFS